MVIFTYQFQDSRHFLGSGFLRSLKLTVCHLRIWYLAPKKGLKLEVHVFSLVQNRLLPIFTTSNSGWIPTRRSLGKLRMFPLHGAIENRSLKQRKGWRKPLAPPIFGGGIFGGTLPKTKISPLKTVGHTKRKQRLYSNHPFSGGKLFVSGRVVCRFGWNAAQASQIFIFFGPDFRRKPSYKNHIQFWGWDHFRISAVAGFVKQMTGGDRIPSKKIS